MESVFCFEIAIETLKLRKRIYCGIPFVAVAFLDFPSIVLRLNEAKHNETNEYAFEKGKSCLFKISPTKLYESLKSSPIYIVVLDQQSSDKTRQPTIGTSSLDLSETIQDVIRDMQTYGLHKTTCHGGSRSIIVVNFLQDVVGCMQVAFKLTSLGHAMLPHLSAVKIDDCPKASEIQLCKPCPLQPLPCEDNVVCPPVLYYQAEKPKENIHLQKSKDLVNDADTQSKDTKDKQSKMSNLEKSREMTVRGWRDKTGALIKINTTSEQKCESTQTDTQHLNQFPILQSLIEEVLQLGLNRPSSAPARKSLPKPAADLMSELVIQRPFSGRDRRVKQVAYTGITSQHPEKSSVRYKRTYMETPGGKKQYPLRYGLTKTHMLRLSQNKQVEFSNTGLERLSPRKPKIKRRKSPPKRKETRHPEAIPPQLASTFTQTIPQISRDDLPISESISSDVHSVELNLDLNKTEIEDSDKLLDRSSPRALSRQSIEIRLPTAETVHEEDLSNRYKYSDDFDEEKSWSYDRTASALTTFDSYTQNTAYEASKENTELESPSRLTVDYSPQPTASDISPTISFGITPRDSIPEEPEKEFIEMDKEEKETKSEDNIITHFKPSPSTLSPRQNSTNDDDSKRTDDSAASIVTTLMAAKLPKPAPSSDSPVIRSLASEPGSRKPRPPSMSHSSSMERIYRRRLKQSSDSSFHMSDISDVRTSDLADIKTSDLSDLKSSDENISPLNSTDIFGRKMPFSKLKKKMKY